MFVLIGTIGGANALLAPVSGATRLSDRSAVACDATRTRTLPVALTSAVAAFASASSAMAATDGGVDLGTIQSIAIELPAAVAGLAGLAGPEAGLAAAGVVVVGGGGFFLSQQAAEKARQEEEERERKRSAEFQAMKTRDNNAGIISMGLPAALSVGYFVWLVSNFS